VKPLNRQLSILNPLLLCLLLLTGCMSTELMNIPGESNTDRTLRRDTYRMVAICERARNGSTYPRVLNTKIVEPPNAKTGVWKEVWTVSRLGQPMEYLITFTPSPRGGTDIGVKMPGKTEK
jgi:hypothetical protein